MPLSTLVAVILIPVLITGCERAIEGDWGGTALTALVQSFVEVIYATWLKIIEWVAGLIVFVAIVWLFLRKR